MRRLAALAMLMYAYGVDAEVRCSSTPCIDSVGGFSSPVTNDPVTANGAWTFDKQLVQTLGAATPSAGAANAVETGTNAGCVTFEGATADGSETLVCGLDGNKDGTLFVNATTAQGVELSTPFNGGVFDGIAISPGTYTVLQVQGPGFVKMRNNVYICLTDGNAQDTCRGGFIKGPDANGVGVQMASGSTGASIGYIQSAQLRNPQITTYTTTAPDSGSIFTNAADPDGATITLLNDPPADPMAVWYDFAVTDAQTFTIQPSAGETLYSGASACSTLSSSVVGSIAHVVATTGGSGAKWMSQLNGTWVCVP